MIKKTERQKMTHKTRHRKRAIGQHDPTSNHGLTQYVPEGQVIPDLPVSPVAFHT
jgi:hypothetical protein